MASSPSTRVVDRPPSRPAARWRGRSSRAIGWLGLAAALASVTGCKTDYGISMDQHPVLEVMPAALRFSEENPTGSVESAAVTISNVGDAAVEIDVIAFDPGAPSSLAVVGDTTATLAPGHDHEVTVTYAPTIGLPRTATLHVVSNAPPASVPILIEPSKLRVEPKLCLGPCICLDPSDCEYSPDPHLLDFGVVPAGTCREAEIGIHNAGLGWMRANPRVLPGAHPDIEAIRRITGTEWVAPIGSGLPGRYLDARYCATTAPEVEARIVIETNDPDAPTFEVRLVGRSEPGGTCPLVADGCLASETCDNGLDDDCDGQVDDGCPCAPGAVRGCFAGPPGRRGVGACTDGTMRCSGDGATGLWGPCTGGIAPRAEVCDALDNDCEGCVDQGLNCGPVTFACPDSASLPEGVPFQDYVIDASSWVTGMAASWSWTVQGGPCDQLFATTTNPVRQSFTLTGQNTSTLRFRPTLSGDYTVTSSIVDGTGATHACTFVVHVAGPGLRVEMCSDKTGVTDLDLHLHRPSTPAVGWFQEAGNSACSYLNCKATSFPPASWGYANSPLASCVGGPEGADWQALGHCRNPRLDIDNVDLPGVAENINVDVPENAAYRVMVNYFRGTGVVRPLVNVYCGGRLKATYGQAPDLVAGFDQAGENTTGDMWRVVDVTPTVVNGVTTDCTVAPLHPPGQMSGYWVATTPRTY